MSFDLKHAELVCKINKGRRACRYIAPNPEGGFECLKYTEAREIIDEKVREGNYVPEGDNCGGLLFSEFDITKIEEERECQN